MVKQIWNYVRIKRKKQKQSPRGVLRNFAEIHRKTPVPESPATLLKKATLAQVFSCEFCEMSKNTFSHKTPPVAASEKKNKPFKDEQKQKVLFITNILITAKSISKWTNFVETSSPTTLFLSFVFLHIKWKIITKNNHKFCELEFYYLKNWKMIFELVIEFYFKLFNFISECAFTRVINVCRCDWIIQLWTVINVCKCD